MSKVSLRVFIKGIKDYLEQGQYDKAIVHCKHVLSFYPKHIETYRLLGQAFYEKKEYENAADIFERVLAVMPDDILAHKGMSRLSEAGGDLNAAIWHMERAFEIQPSDREIQDQLRVLFGRRDGIEPPKIRLTKGALVRMYARGELHSQAVFEILDILANDPHRYDMEVILAKMYYELGKYEDAQVVCLRLIENLPFCYDANRILSDILIHSQREKEAVQYLKRIEAIDPYTQFISINYPSAEYVPDDKLMIEALDDVLVYKGHPSRDIKDDQPAGDQPASTDSRYDEKILEELDSDDFVVMDHEETDIHTEHSLKSFDVEAEITTSLPDWSISQDGEAKGKSEDAEFTTEISSVNTKDMARFSETEDNGIIHQSGTMIELPEWFDNKEQAIVLPVLEDKEFTAWQKEIVPEDLGVSEFVSMHDEVEIEDKFSIKNIRVEEDLSSALELGESTAGEIDASADRVIGELDESISTEKTSFSTKLGEPSFSSSQRQRVMPEPPEEIFPEWMDETDTDLQELFIDDVDHVNGTAPDWINEKITVLSPAKNQDMNDAGEAEEHERAVTPEKETAPGMEHDTKSTEAISVERGSQECVNGGLGDQPPTISQDITSTDDKGINEKIVDSYTEEVAIAHQELLSLQETEHEIEEQLKSPIMVDEKHTKTDEQVDASAVMGAPAQKQVFSLQEDHPAVIVEEGESVSASIQTSENQDELLEELVALEDVSTVIQEEDAIPGQEIEVIKEQITDLDNSLKESMNGYNRSEIIGDVPEWIKEIETEPEVIVLERSKWVDNGLVTTANDTERVDQVDVIHEQPKTEVRSKKDKGQKQSRRRSVHSSIQSSELEVGRTAFQAGDIEKALGSYNKMIVQNRDIEIVIEDLEKALELQPENIDIMQSLGDAYLRMDRLQDALNTYNNALEILE